LGEFPEVFRLRGVASRPGVGSVNCLADGEMKELTQMVRVSVQ
jgi:hypothetical protein